MFWPHLLLNRHWVDVVMGSFQCSIRQIILKDSSVKIGAAKDAFLHSSSLKSYQVSAVRNQKLCYAVILHYFGCLVKTVAFIFKCLLLSSPFVSFPLLFLLCGFHTWILYSYHFHPFHFPSSSFLSSNFLSTISLLLYSCYTYTHTHTKLFSCLCVLSFAAVSLTSHSLPLLSCNFVIFHMGWW